MTEQERVEGQNDSLKEILGFDPESGVRVEERSGLTTIKETKIAIPEDVQDEFLEVFEREREFTAIHPQKLLTIASSPQGVTRSYYSWQPSLEGRTSFPLVVEANFKKDADRFEPSGILFQGEALPSQAGKFIAGRYIAHEFSTINFRDFDSNITSFQIAIAERLCYLKYTNKGSLIEINFWMQRQGAAFLDEHGISLQAEIGKLLDQGTFEEKRGVNNYKFTVLEEKINLKRFEEGELKDELMLPRKIDQKAIIEELFDSPTLEDPIKAPPELDDSWRFANLMEVVGVKWERY